MFFILRCPSDHFLCCFASPKLTFGFSYPNNDPVARKLTSNEYSEMLRESERKKKEAEELLRSCRKRKKLRENKRRKREKRRRRKKLKRKKDKEQQKRKPVVTAASSGGVARISERSSGISPAATKGFTGEYLGCVVLGIAST